MNRIFDVEKYTSLMQVAASLSWLYSENDVAYINSRLVERIYILASSSRDLARADCSFDAIFNDVAGVGIKTFLGSIAPDTKKGSKLEKVAEFTKMARAGEFAGLRGANLARTVSLARNARIFSDVNEYGLNLSDSFYHCFIRTSLGGIMHEETYPLIDVHNLRPTNSRGIEIDNWPRKQGQVHFSDGRSHYSFSISKNVLFKRFEYQIDKQPIPLVTDKDIFERLPMLLGGGGPTPPQLGNGSPLQLSQLSFDSMSDRPGIDYVILPLYSERGGAKFVPERSGINQWNARGRSRMFGEAYIPIPAQIHTLCPKFFPPRDQPFTLHLPTGTHSGKVCQDNSKALMTDPNRALGYWIHRVVDPSIPASDFEEAPARLNPFSYKDLLAIGKDSILVRRYKDGLAPTYSLQFAEIGAYEDFVDDLQLL